MISFLWSAPVTSDLSISAGTLPNMKLRERGPGSSSTCRIRVLNLATTGHNRMRRALKRITEAPRSKEVDREIVERKEEKEEREEEKDKEVVGREVGREAEEDSTRLYNSRPILSTIIVYTIINLNTKTWLSIQVWAEQFPL